VFAVAGLVPDGARVYLNLDDVWEGRVAAEALQERGQQQELCTWRELLTMQNSGVVDVQCHSLTHARVPICPQVVDFLRPDFDPAFANVNIPLSSLDIPTRPERPLRLGAPVFASTPLLGCQTWFREAPNVAETLVHYVAEKGGTAFFQRPSWRKELLTLFRSWPKEKLGDFRPASFRRAAIRDELSYSRRILEKRLNKSVQHFCYPWYASSLETDHLAHEAGYRVLYYGPALRRSAQSPRTTIKRIRRLPEEYFFCLPGEGRRSLWSVWRQRLRNFSKPT